MFIGVDDYHDVFSFQFNYLAYQNTVSCHKIIFISFKTLAHIGSYRCFKALGSWLNILKCLSIIHTPNFLWYNSHLLNERHRIYIIIK